MATPHHGTVQSLLRPSDSLQSVLIVELDADNPADYEDTLVRRRLIAVVTHSQETEVGSLLVLDASATRVVDARPITEHLTLAVAQTAPLDFQAERTPTWLLTIRRDAQDTRPLAFVVRRGTQALQNFTAECRRLKDIAAATHPASSDFSWIDVYLADAPTHRLDLRLRRKALHTRLSQAAAGFSGDDVSDISTVRRHWVEQAAAKEASNDDVMHLSIRLGTFNVNGKNPSQDLHPWLRGAKSKNYGKTGWISPLQLSSFEIVSDPLQQELRKKRLLASTSDVQAIGDADILVLGFQELDQSAEALLYVTSTLKEDEWLAAIFAGLGEKRVLYEKLTSKQLVGMLLVVIVKKILVPCFTDVRTCYAGSGIMGFMGNKGATAVRIEFTPKMSTDPKAITRRSTILTFVNAHLAASDDMTERRNYDFQELRDTYNIYQGDVLFWMGGDGFHCRQRFKPNSFCPDLNYRLDLPDGDIRSLLSSHLSGIDDIQTLLLYDQLRAAMRNNKAFSGFTEHAMTHSPTYRLALGVPKDRLGYDLKRKPAWTDRVLYMAPPDVNVVQLAYRSHPEITMSDHYPVSADFDVSVPLIDQTRYENATLALHRELDALEDYERRRQIKVQPSSIEFGAIQYKRAVHREVVVQNEGEVPCVFRFVGTGTDSGSISPPWLRIEPMVGLLRPRESMTILLAIYVDNDCAARLNLGPPALSCTLILHTALGRDHFLAVSGQYQYTCFANTLQRLVRLAGPIRHLGIPEGNPGGQASAPREIMRLINWMMTQVSATDTLFECPAHEGLCDVVRECLDTGDAFPEEGPEADHGALVAAFSSTLVRFLDSLVEPVVPAHLHARCVLARDKDEAFEVLDGFPHESINVWISLSAFLHYAARQCDDGSSGAGRSLRLASVFAPVLLRDDPSGVYPRASPVGKRNFLLLFID